MEFTVYMVYTLSSSPPCLLVYKGRRREACLIGSYRLTPFVISKCRCFVIGQSLFENLTQTIERILRGLQLSKTIYFLLVFVIPLMFMFLTYTKIAVSLG